MYQTVIRLIMALDSADNLFNKKKIIYTQVFEVYKKL